MVKSTKMLRTSERAGVNNELLNFRLHQCGISDKSHTDGYRSNNGASFFLYVREKETNMQARPSLDPPVNPNIYGPIV